MDRPSPSHTIGTARLSILTKARLLDHIYQGCSLPQIRQFLPLEQGGAFAYFDVQALLTPTRGKRFFLLLEVLEEPVGLAELEGDPRQPKVFRIRLISIDPRQRGKGYASRIAERIFRLAKQEGYTLEVPSYSDEGIGKLKPLLNRLAAKYEVPFVDAGDLAQTTR